MRDGWVSERVTKRRRLPVAWAELITVKLLGLSVNQPRPSQLWALAKTGAKISQAIHSMFHVTACSARIDEQDLDITSNASSHSYLPYVFVEIVIATHSLSSVCPHLAAERVGRTHLAAPS